MPLNATECGAVYCNAGFSCSAGQCINEEALAQERAASERAHQEPQGHTNQTTTADHQDARSDNTLLFATIATVVLILCFIIPSFLRNLGATASSTPPQTMPRQSPFAPQLQPGEILVRDKASGQIGAIPETEYDVNLYERI